MKKILILVPNDVLGGAEQHLKNIAEYMISEGYEVYVFFLKKEKTGGWKGLTDKVNLFFTKNEKERWGVLGCLFKLVRNRHTQYEYVFTSHIHLNSFAGVLIRFGIIKTKFFVGRESTSIFKRFTGTQLRMYRFMYRLGYSKLDLLICQTNFMKEQLVQALPKLATKIKIEVIPNPINLKKTNIENENFEFRNEKYIVSAGRLIQLKGFDLLIKAFALIKVRYPDLKLIILGEGAERENLENLAKDLGIMESVQLVGFQDNVYPFFRHASVCVVSSIIEGFPNVLLQMMSQNNTVVSTLCAGGIEEIPSIYTCKINNSEDLATKIEYALKADTNSNREVFDSFLETRSIACFVEQINKYLNV